MRIIGTVVSIPQAGSYRIKDSKGAEYRVFSQETYSIGESVVVLDSQIVGKAGKQLQPTVYEV